MHVKCEHESYLLEFFGAERGAAFPCLPGSDASGAFGGFTYLNMALPGVTKSLILFTARDGWPRLASVDPSKKTEDRGQAWNRTDRKPDPGLLLRSSDFPAERLVSAFGDPISKEGRIEVYLDNKLFMIFLFKRNENFASEP